MGKGRASMRLMSRPCRLVAMSKTRMWFSERGWLRTSPLCPEGLIVDKQTHRLLWAARK